MFFVHLDRILLNKKHSIFRVKLRPYGIYYTGLLIYTTLLIAWMNVYLILLEYKKAYNSSKYVKKRRGICSDLESFNKIMQSPTTLPLSEANFEPFVDKFILWGSGSPYWWASSASSFTIFVEKGTTIP